MNRVTAPLEAPGVPLAPVSLKDAWTKTGTLMQGSKHGCLAWSMASYLITTSLGGVARIRFHRDLGIRQACTRHLTHHARDARHELTVPCVGALKIDWGLVCR